MRGPIVWPGGKGRMVTKLLPYIPKHQIYVEPFGGGASLLFSKPLPENKGLEVYNDINEGVVNLFRVMRNPDTFDDFARKVNCTPHSRKEYMDCRNWMIEQNSIDKAYKFYVACRQAFPGRNHNKTGWAYGKKFKGIYWMTAVKNLPDIHERLMDVQIDCLDYKEIFQRYDGATTFFYCDPPYFGSEGSYNIEFNHEEFLLDVTRLQGKVMISNYDNYLYDVLDDIGWGRVEFKSILTRKHDKQESKVEVIWMNYHV